VALGGDKEEEPLMRIAITGGTGLIGTALAARLQEANHEVLVAKRGPESDPDAAWDPAAGWINPEAFAGFDALVNLAGASIGDGRWGKRRKRELVDSRVEATRLLANHLERLPGEARPSIFVNASAVGFYGDAGDEELREDAPRGEGFLAELCADWEAQARRVSFLGLRSVQLRTGIVLSKEGGVLPRMLLPFRLGLGGRLGSGRQWMSWIGLDDATRAIEFALNQPIEGPLNLVAPSPVTNREFTKALGRQLRRPTVLPLPAFQLRLLFGRGRANELFLASQRAIPSRLQQAGFTVEQPEIAGALRAAFEARPAAAVPERQGGLPVSGS
jgi:uncharacterized protein (TIGR01777 family)